MQIKFHFKDRKMENESHLWIENGLDPMEMKLGGNYHDTIWRK